MAATSATAAITTDATAVRCRNRLATAGKDSRRTGVPLAASARGAPPTPLGRLADPEPLVDAAERGGRPPVPLAEEPHQRRDEQCADDGRVDDHGDGGADAELLDE